MPYVDRLTYVELYGKSVRDKNELEYKKRREKERYKRGTLMTVAR